LESYTARNMDLRMYHMIMEKNKKKKTSRCPSTIYLPWTTQDQWMMSSLCRKMVRKIKNQNGTIWNKAFPRQSQRSSQTIIKKIKQRCPWWSLIMLSSWSRKIKALRISDWMLLKDREVRITNIPSRKLLNLLANISNKQQCSIFSWQMENLAILLEASEL
jgi:hypothetical protein